ncbi:MAG: phosphate butyryltransferase, partial [Rickettsiales bacterium]|nr:phosphate butyryltransferase [Rickettsiales bacterium]
MKFEQILKSLKPQTPKIIAVAAAHDETVLKAITKASEQGFANPILCGESDKIKDIADKLNLDISNFEIINTKSNEEAASVAVKLVREKRADILMKGLLQTAELLRAVLNKEEGIRGDGIISHVSVLHNPELDKTLILTDAAFIPYPDFETKIQLIKNATNFAKSFGIETPKVAVLAAVETINPKMQAT